VGRVVPVPFVGFRGRYRYHCRHGQTFALETRSKTGKTIEEGVWVHGASAICTWQSPLVWARQPPHLEYHQTTRFLTRYVEASVRKHILCSWISSTDLFCFLIIVVALIVRKGGCSLEEKALVASTLIHPPGVVQYIIVDGDKSLASLNDYSPEEQQVIITLPEQLQEQDGVSVISTDEDLLGFYDERSNLQVHGMERDRHDDDDDEEERLQLGEDDLRNDDESIMGTVPPPQVQNRPSENLLVWNQEQDVNFLRNDDESIPASSRALRRRKKHKNDKITVAVLRVSYNVGYELLDLVLREPAETRDMGGPKIVMDNKEPSASAKTVFLWVVLSASMSASVCLCLMLFVNRGIFEQEEPAAPRPPVRRRLTHEQVRGKYPAFSFQETPGGEPLDDCAICLDEFMGGNQCRQLPCQHVFHGTCIARWLIERSATCPLCKVDLYEDDESSGSSSAEIPSLNTWWGGMMSRASQEPVTNNIAATTAPPQVIQTQTSWWRRRQEQSAVGTADQTETTRPSRSLWFSFDGWRGSLFGQRRDAAEGALTELTEPLLVENREEVPSVQADEASNNSSPASAVESSQSSPAEESSTPPVPTIPTEESASTGTPSEIESNRSATSAEI
jgi:hypothetical protein